MNFKWIQYPRRCSTRSRDQHIVDKVVAFHSHLQQENMQECNHRQCLEFRKVFENNFMMFRLACDQAWWFMTFNDSGSCVFYMKWFKIQQLEGNKNILTSRQDETRVNRSTEIDIHCKHLLFYIVVYLVTMLLVIDWVGGWSVASSTLNWTQIDTN